MSVLLKNSTLKRVFSWVLAFCMTVGLMPAFAFEATAADAETLSYEWRVVSPYQRRGSDTTIKLHTKYAMNQVTSYDMIDTFLSQMKNGRYDAVEGYLKYSAPWMYAGESGEAGTVQFVDEDAGILLSNIGDWVSFLVKVDTGANYDISSRLRFNAICGAITEIYFAPKGEVSGAADTMNAKYLIATVDQHLNREKSSGDTNVPLASNVEVAAGEYYVTYKVARESTASDASTYIQNFKLTPHDASAEKSASPVITPAEREFLYTTDVTVDSASQVATSSATKDRAFYKTGVDSYWENPAAVIRMSTVPLSTSKPVDASPIKFTISEKTKVSAVATDYIGRNGTSSFKAPSDSVNVTFTPKTIVIPEPKGSYTYDMAKANGEDATGITYEKTESGSESEVNADVASAPWAYNAGALAYDAEKGALSVSGSASIKVKVGEDGDYIPAIRPDAANEGDVTVKFYAVGESSPLAEKTIAVADMADEIALADEFIALTAGDYIFEIAGDAALVDAFALNLRPYDLEYNFLKGWTGNAMADVDNIEYAMTTPGATFEINPDIKSDPWEFHSKDVLGGNSYFKFTSKASGLAFSSVSSYIGSGSVKIKVPVSGPYIPYATLPNIGAGKPVVILSKLDSDGAIGQQLVKSDAILATSPGDYALCDIPVYLEAGEYVVTLTAATKGANLHCMSGFKLVSTYGIDAFIVLDATGIAEVDLNNEVEIPLNIRMTDESEPDWSKISVDVACDAENITEAAVNIADGAASVIFRGLAVGKTTATITVDNGETKRTHKINVIVNEEGYSTTLRDLHYDFLKGWSGDTSHDWPKKITYSMTTTGSVDEINTGIVSEPWEYHSDNSTGGNNYFKYNYASYGISKSLSGYGALKIKIPVSGKYQPQVVPFYASNLPMNIGLHKLAEDGTIGDLVAETGEFSVSGTQNKTYTLCDDQIYLEKGEYVVKLTVKAGSGLCIMDSFSLVNLDSKLKFEDASVAVIKGDTEKCILNVSDYANNKISASNATFNVTVKDEKIATAEVAADGEDITVSVTGIKIGTTTATVTVTALDGKVGEYELPITVTPEFELLVDMPVDEMVEFGHDTTIPISVHYIDARTGLDNGEVSATITADVIGTSLSAKVVNGTDNKNNSIVLTGKSIGTDRLTVKIAVGEVAKTYVYPMLVYSNAGNTEKTYDFSIKHSIYPYNKQISAVNSYFMTMPGTGMTMKESESGTWMYAGQSEGTVFKNYYGTYGAAIESGTGSWGAIKVRLPEGGLYQIVGMGCKYPMSGIMRMYVAPADAENPMEPKYAVGTADNYMPGTKDDITYDNPYLLGTFNYPAGDYIVTWENIGYNPAGISNSRIITDGVRFVPKTELPSITLSADTYTAEVRKYNSVKIPLSATVSDGTDDDLYGAEFVVTASNEGIAAAKAVVNEKGKTELVIEGVESGQTKLGVEMRRNGVSYSSIEIDVTVREQAVLSSVDVGVVGSETDTISLHAINTDANKCRLEVKLFDEDNVEISQASIDAQGISYAYSSADPSIAAVDQNGHINAYKAGKVEVICTVTLGATTVVGKVTLNVTTGKTRQSYYTAEKVAAARENIEKYSWAKTSVESHMKAADKYVGQEERLWNLFTPQELPRSYYVGYRGDPDGLNAICRYCGVSIAAKYGSSYGWLYDAWNDPWKVQCPDCRRKFPSNDFGGFYEIGIDEHGNWSYELAKQKNAELVAAGEDGYLKNILYPEKGEGWAVDDGYGYKTGKMIANTDGNMIEETDTYIAFYNMWAVYFDLAYNSVTNLEQAYLYTGEEKYGRVAAIMLDRLADFYPEYDTNAYVYEFSVNGNYTPNGVYTDATWECQYAQEWARAYDSVWPMYEDEYVINFLSEKAEKYNMENDKSTPALIRTNIEDGILREVFKEIQRGNFYGNFGMHQSTLLLAAVSLDTMPETRDMIDWVFRDGENNYHGELQVCEITGGDVYRTLINKVDRDGNADEVAQNYSALWSNSVRRIVDTLAGYDGYPEANMYRNPRYHKMLTFQPEIILRRKATPTIGDSGATALDGIIYSTQSLIPAFQATGDVIFAQMLYFLNGNKSDGLHYDIFTKNPESLAAEVSAIIDEHGEYDFDESTNLADMGFAALRDGSYYKVSGQNDIDTQRAFWMYYGRSSGHGHHDALNLGIEAFGLSLTPDFGYPMASTGDDYTNWGHSTAQHNTVLVNDASQSGNYVGGKVYHYDDDGRVSLIDAESKHQYNSVSDYRRSVVMVNVDSENSYGVDFFHVNGGSEHVYALHALSDTIAETVGLDNLKPQVDEKGNYIGSYAGADVPWKTMGNRSGYTYLYNVDRAANVGNFAVDFKITDFRDVLANEGDIRLRMTMLNGFDLSEVAIADGDPPARDNNPQGLKFVLARRSGTNLNTLFTTVLEPYEDNRYIDSMESVSVSRADGTAISQDEMVRAVKVTLTSGRIDYIVYAQDNTVEYVIDNLFNMRGFVGVYTMQDGENIYSYVNDGDKIGDTTGLGAVTGTVADFTKDIVFDNYIDVTVNEDIDPQSLVGKYIYIDKAGNGNAAYEILDAEGEGKNISLYVGNVTTVDSTASGEYLYHMAKGTAFRIPLTVRNDASPVFAPIPKRGVESGSELVFNVSATSPIDNEITYRAGTLPRGAQFDPESGRFAWIPDSAQVGNHVATFIASNGALESILEVELEVYFGTGGISPSAGVTTPGSTTAPDDGKTDEENPDDDGNTDEQTKRFIDLGNHKWAEEAIYRLVDRGVINGTSENTYSPGADITRADFTTLIVRAFNFTAETDENFPDVEQGKYYTDTIAIAKALGIVNGDSKGNFNPKASISRQDMMVIIARAAEAANLELSGDIENNFPDKDDVAGYAKDAVDLLIKSGIVAGSNGRINPLGTTTRAEVAVVLDRLINK